MLNFVILLEERRPTDLHKHFLRIIQSLNCNLWTVTFDWNYGHMRWRFSWLQPQMGSGMHVHSRLYPKWMPIQRDAPAALPNAADDDDDDDDENDDDDLTGGYWGWVGHNSYAGIWRICSEGYSLYHLRIFLCCLWFCFLLVQFKVLMCCAITRMGCMLGLKRRNSKSKSNLVYLERIGLS